MEESIKSLHDNESLPNIMIDINSNTVKVENIQLEDNLIEYTDNHFMNRTFQDLEKIRNGINNPTVTNIDHTVTVSESYTDVTDAGAFQTNYLRSNSPVMSLSGSRSNSDDDDEDYGDDGNIGNFHQTNKPYKKLAYRDVERSIERYYDIDNKYSSEIDILTTYMKGQKNLYVQSKHLIQWKLNCLMLPSLIISAVITAIAPFIECMRWSGACISALNAIVALFISLINYLKFESSIEMYLQMATHFDNMQTSLELTNSKIIFLKKDREISSLALAKIKEIEEKMSEIKISNSILIPEEIKTIFPIICSINIFSFIKKTEIYKQNLIKQLKDVKNEIQFILYKLDKSHVSLLADDNVVHVLQHGSWERDRRGLDQMKEKTRLLYLYDIKKKVEDEIIEFRSTYGSLDDIFTREIKRAESIKNMWFNCLWRKKNDYLQSLNGTNPVIMKHYKAMFDPGN